MYKYEKINGHSFKLISASKEGAPSITFEVSKELSMWQTMQFTGHIAGFLSSSGEMGKLIGTSLIALMREGFASDDSIKKSLGNLLNAFQNLSEGNFATGITTGVADVLKFLSEEDRLARYGATLFLKVDEYRITEEELSERIEMFQCVPMSQLLGGLTYFFTDKIESLKNTISRLRTSGVSAETTPSTPPTQTLNVLTPTLIGLTD